MSRQEPSARRAPQSRRKPKPKAKAAPIREARPIYSERQLRALSLDQAHARGEALEALSLMRTKRFSLTRAAREVGLTREAVRAWVGPSIRKQRRRYTARGSDRLIRQMKVITPRGVESMPIFDSRVASRLGTYNAAVKEALRGNVVALKPFRGKSFRTGGKRGFPFITDMRILKRLAQAGALPEYDIYVH